MGENRDADHKHLDSRLVGTSRLIMLTPDYLTTSQSEEGPQADQASYDSLP